MSTYLYLECLDHDPPLQSDEEVGQHLYDLSVIRGWVADRDQIAVLYRDMLWDDMGYFQRPAWKFLHQHPRCRIGIRDGYGEEHPIEAPDEAP